MCRSTGVASLDHMNCYSIVEASSFMQVVFNLGFGMSNCDNQREPLIMFFSFHDAGFIPSTSLLFSKKLQHSPLASADVCF